MGGGPMQAMYQSMIETPVIYRDRTGGAQPIRGRSTRSTAADNSEARRLICG